MENEELVLKRKQSTTAFVLAIFGFQLSIVCISISSLSVYAFRAFADGSNFEALFFFLLISAAFIATPIVALYLRHMSKDITLKKYRVFNAISLILSIVALSIVGLVLVIVSLEGIFLMPFMI